MSTVIDWSKCGRTKPKRNVCEVTYREHGRVIADFHLEHLDEVYERLKKQRDYWKRTGNDFPFDIDSDID